MSLGSQSDEFGGAATLAKGAAEPWDGVQTVNCGMRVRRRRTEPCINALTMRPHVSPNRCRKCGATSYRRVVARDDKGAMRLGDLYQCSGCDVVFADPKAWREGEIEGTAKQSTSGTAQRAEVVRSSDAQLPLAEVPILARGHGSGDSLAGDSV